MDKTLSTLIKIALFSALSVTVMLIPFLKFPIFPVIGFMDLDFSNVFSLFGGFLLGPLAAILIEFFKILLYALIKGTSTGYVGEFANFIIATAFVLPATILYKYKKGVKWVLLGLIFSVLCVVIVGTLVNYFVLFPLFLPKGHDMLTFKFIVTWIPAFNAIKYGLAAIIVFLLYKRIKFLFRW